MTDRTCACGADLSGLNRAVKRCGECCTDIMRAAQLEPLAPYPGSVHARWKCRCLRCREVVEPCFANVQERGAGCNPCARRAQAVTRHLPEARAVAVMRAAGLEPLEPYADSGEPWECRCMKCGEVVSPRYNDVQQGQGGCWPCGRAAKADLDRIPESEAVALAHSAGLEPLEPYRNNSTRWRCLCLTCDTETFPRLSTLKRGSAGCSWCSRHYVPPEEACTTMRAAGLEPLVPYPGSNTPWPCRCITCGDTVSSTHWNVKDGHRCGSCFPGGFHPGMPSVVYLVIHEEYDATKIGVMNEGTTRLADHRRRGWCTVMTVNVSGRAAQAIEYAILAWWRHDLALPPYLGATEMPGGGWTETVASSGIDLAATIRRIRSMTAA